MKTHLNVLLIFLLIYLFSYSTLCIEVDNPDAINLNFKPDFQPVIGIISQPVIGTNTSEIQQSYVNFIETGGGRVAPIPLDSSDEELAFYVKSINGVLFPGGGTPLNPDERYYSIHKFFLDYSIQEYEKGNHFPVWGTCLGFQAIIQYFSNNMDLISNSYIPDFNVLLPLEWNKNKKMIHKSSMLNLCKETLLLNDIESPSHTNENEETDPTEDNVDNEFNINKFKDILKRDLSENSKEKDYSSVHHHHWSHPMCSYRLFTSLHSLPLSAYNHQHGVTSDDWDLNPLLNETLYPLAYSTTNEGIRFVAMVESKKYPIYAVQFHPEKNLFAFSSSINAPHSFFSSEATQYFANFIINEARKSNQRFDDPMTEFNHLIFKYSIYNHPLSDKIYDFLPMYLFPMDQEIIKKTVSIEVINKIINEEKI